MHLSCRRDAHQTVLQSLNVGGMQEEQSDERARERANTPPEQLWFIENNAYDFSTWLDDHPGGAAILLQTRGSDVTALFHSYHTFAPSLSSPALRKASLAQYLVRAASPAEVIDSRMFEWAATPKYDELKRRTRQHFGSASHKAPMIALAWHAFWVLLFLRQALLWTRGEGALLLGLGIWYGSGDVLHTGSHYGIFRSVRLNLLAAYTIGMLHCNPSTWLRQHVIGHHVATNLDGRDPDMHHFDQASQILRVIGFRLSTADPKPKPWRGHAPWWLALPWLALLTGIVPMLVESIDFLCVGKLLWIWLAPQYVGSGNSSGLSRGERAYAITQWALTLSAILIVGVNHGPLHALTPFFVHGYLYYAFSQVSHTNEPSGPPDPDATASQVTPFQYFAARKRTECAAAAPPLGEWAAWQFHTSRGDWGWNLDTLVGRAIAPAISNGLNLQAVHHIFPNIHWAHYSALYPMICEVLGEPPVAAQSYTQSFKQHLRFLDKLNGQPLAEHAASGVAAKANGTTGKVE